MADRDGEYVLVRKSKKSRDVYYNDDDDDDDDDNDSMIYRRINRRKARGRYVSNDDIDSDYRRQFSDSRIKIRKTTQGDRVILDEDDNIIKVMRDTRSPSPLPRRIRQQRPREAQSIFYETSNGHLISRPMRKNAIPTKKSQLIYADDEPTKVIKKVIIDPRTGERETIYERDRPRKQQKYYLQQRSMPVYYDSDESDDQQYVRIGKQRTMPRREPAPKYFMIRNKHDSEPVYASTSRMPAIQTSRRVVYEVPAKKQPLTTYIYPHGKYYK